MPDLQKKLPNKLQNLKIKIMTIRKKTPFNAESGNNWTTIM